MARSHAVQAREHSQRTGPVPSPIVDSMRAQTARLRQKALRDTLVWANVLSNFRE